MDDHKALKSLIDNYSEKGKSTIMLRIPEYNLIISNNTDGQWTATQNIGLGNGTVLHTTGEWLHKMQKEAFGDKSHFNYLTSLLSELKKTFPEI